MDDLFPSERDTIYTPTAADPRTRINQRHALYELDSNAKTNIVAFSEFIHAVRPGIYEYKPTVSNIIDSLYFPAPLAGVPGSVHHEAFHALNDSTALFGLPLVSDSWQFREAYEKDLAALGGYEGAYEKDYAYYARPDNPSDGRHEAFSELGAEAMNAGRYGLDMAHDWPNTYAYVRQFLREATVASSTGTANFIRFLDTIREKKPRHAANEPYVNPQLSRNLLVIMKNRPAASVKDFAAWISVTDPRIVQRAIEDENFSALHSDPFADDKTRGRFLAGILAEPTSKAYFLRRFDWRLSGLLEQATKNGCEEAAQALTEAGAIPPGRPRGGKPKSPGEPPPP
ncbi:MAG: hypothetical protein KGI97_01260 [Alphaproteobacteria bacterium]|nr:hypothetical protein [Alphaproteobacteria bacterium]